MQTHEWENMLSDVEEKYWDYPIQTQLALAEVVRLRRAITDLRDDYLAHIADVLHHSASRDLFVDQVSGLVVEIREDVDDYYGTAADDLNRILEGEE